MNSVSEEPGDLFEAPPRSALIHACSARGSWGKGIALDFARKYPWAYRRYRQHCLKQKDKNEVYDIPDLHATGDGTKTVSVRWPVGTALIIYPESLSFPSGANPWIICLFTSFDYGKRVDSPQMILNSTNAALHDLQNQLITMEGGDSLDSPLLIVFTHVALTRVFLVFHGPRQDSW
ncbi:hypothetical protein N7454_007346 [Penicillium verhagenii]|nr:hypothetical protein N7454_007346 [Penicillium verhagenii]